MSLDSILQAMLDAERGILAAALMDGDGIPIAEARGALAGSLIPDSGLSTLAVEFSRALAEVEKASDVVGGGRAGELIVSMTRLTLIFAAVETGLTLVLATEPDGNLGKARYLIRRNLLEIRQQL
jgi:predicted regulator of Ras-like GTPase activity (Roadblock/LC7/MglB family)